MPRARTASRCCLCLGLLGCLLAGCRGTAPLHSAERLEHGYVMVLPGILGQGVWNDNIARGLDDAGVKSAIEICDWTQGPLMLSVNVLHWRRKEREARSLAKKIVDYQDAYPNRPVALIGHSGGAAMALRVIDALPADRNIDNLILLAPGLSPKSDLRPVAMRVEHRVHSFHSYLDLFVGGAFAGAVGTARDMNAASAGNVGFSEPPNLNPEERRWYQEHVVQHAYGAQMAATGHLGGHFGCTTPAFIQQYVAPLLNEGDDISPTDPGEEESASAEVASYEDESEAEEDSERATR